MPPPSRVSLLPTVIVRLVAGMVVIGALVFLPAGTLVYWEAWVWLGIFLGGVLALGAYLWARDPELLERRMRTRETERP